MRFDRVAALLGEGITASVATEHAGLAELLASARLRHLQAGADVWQALAWKGFSLRPTARADITIERVESPRPFSEWRAGHITIGYGDPFGEREVINDVAQTLTKRQFHAGRIYYGDGRWPFGQNHLGHTPEAQATLGHVLIVGLGSVGSEAARHIRARRLTLVDDAVVTEYNPVRQWYGARDIGRRKAEVLAERLHAAAVVQRIDTQADADALVERYHPDTALLATGTHAHGLLATALGQTPYVAACAYALALRFEVIVADWHRYRHTQPVDVPDAVAQFLYTLPDSPERDELVAEPAFAASTARIADIAVRCLSAHVTRPAWFQRCLDQGTTCLIGEQDGGLVRM